MSAAMAAQLGERVREAAPGCEVVSIDVTEREPLPADSTLWSLPNCTITPHDAGYSPLADMRLGELFLDNLGRYARGEPLRNEIQATGLSSKE
jgi:phosphoglycerate dehydrogenase-like enzyme